MVDIDWLKKINDACEHEQRNEVLIGVAKCPRKGTRSSDVVARYGGEEFCAILFGLHSRGCASGHGKNPLLGGIYGLHECKKRDIRVTISLGICSNKATGICKSNDIIRLADESL